jgi:hypothetical protein
MEWYCPTCDDYVSWQSVTFEEFHKPCGTFLGDVNEPNRFAKGCAFGMLFSLPIWACIITVVVLVVIR